MSKLVFLSHIHEEKDLALLLKVALEDEFGGFVDVFQSSDGVSIPAGANFLKRVENGLADCVAAIYLISPQSVKRNWINFELGAVWIRSVLSTRAGDGEIPALPICHSGSTPGSLPAPLNNLNGILATEASQLEAAFRSIQSAVGGKGRLKTDFDVLAHKALQFQESYTIGANLARLFHILHGTREDMKTLIQTCESIPSGPNVPIDIGWRENDEILQLEALESNELKGHIRVDVSKGGVNFAQNRASVGAKVKIEISRGLLIKHKAELLR
ncbi:toll/interleukin-1 receptor domain-containing protein [Massilia solisilvae]|uniref:Toll/interleukin-1 receptor domain-containing protein n=1 Tax=Massilia solisilvae TaxID=1811225 RepID=A0ABT2BFE4_9BURK|nr:toll/interleukin-1 receptor domain-containing protein [Massilia solisilvae]MCS0607241.1 toll/interleukin-1 receptor domain-containing protein [Massilia solisilvae]